MTAESLALVSGAVLSLGFSYIPGLNVKFATLTSIYKRLVMLGCLLIVSLAVYGLSCSGWGDAIGAIVTCDREGLIGLVRSFVLAMIANQAAYLITPPTAAVIKASG